MQKLCMLLTARELQFQRNFRTANQAVASKELSFWAARIKSVKRVDCSCQKTLSEQCKRGRIYSHWVLTFLFDR